MQGLGAILRGGVGSIEDAAISGFARESPLIYQINGKEEKEVFIKTPADLWDLLKQIEEDDLNTK